MANNNSVLVMTSFGNTILNPSNISCTRLPSGEPIEVSISDLEKELAQGYEPEVGYENQYIDKPFEEVEPEVSNHPGFSHYLRAKQRLHQVDSQGNPIPKLKTSLVSWYLSNYSLENEDKVLGQEELDKEELGDLVDLASQAIISDFKKRDIDYKNSNVKCMVRNWVKGQVRCPEDKELLLVLAHLTQHSFFQQFYQDYLHYQPKNPGINVNNNLFCAYKRYVITRQQLKNWYQALKQGEKAEKTLSSLSQRTSKNFSFDNERAALANLYADSIKQQLVWARVKEIRHLKKGDGKSFVKQGKAHLRRGVYVKKEDEEIGIKTKNKYELWNEISVIERTLLNLVSCFADKRMPDSWPLENKIYCYNLIQKEIRSSDLRTIALPQSQHQKCQNLAGSILQELRGKSIDKKINSLLGHNLPSGSFHKLMSAHNCLKVFYPPEIEQLYVLECQVKKIEYKLQRADADKKEKKRLSAEFKDKREELLELTQFVSQEYSDYLSQIKTLASEVINFENEGQVVIPQGEFVDLFTAEEISSILCKYDLGEFVQTSLDIKLLKDYGISQLKDWQIF